MTTRNDYADGKEDGAREERDRIRHAILFERNRLGKPVEKMRVVDILALLDEDEREPSQP